MPRLAAGLSQAKVRGRIKNERREALAFECHRVRNGFRWLLAPATLGANISVVNIIKTGSTHATFT